MKGEEKRVKEEFEKNELWMNGGMGRDKGKEKAWFRNCVHRLRRPRCSPTRQPAKI